jgi:hypothetical protein
VGSEAGNGEGNEEGKMEESEAESEEGKTVESEAESAVGRMAESEEGSAAERTVRLLEQKSLSPKEFQ